MAGGMYRWQLPTEKLRDQINEMMKEIDELETIIQTQKSRIDHLETVIEEHDCDE